MNIQSYLLCILYIIILVIHSITLCQKDYHRGLISIFSIALLAETTWTVLVTTYLLIEQYELAPKDLPGIFDLNPSSNFRYNAQFLHIIAINLFILFLLIIAKGYPITRRTMPFKHAFAVFWLSCVIADLSTYYWTTISVNLYPSESIVSHNSMQNSSTQQNQSISDAPSNSSMKLEGAKRLNPNSYDNFNSTSHKMSLLLRIVIMVYFLLELRTTMILEQEKRKLQFYLHFGALTMVWLVHTLIVYVISLRVDETWRAELISACSTAANFIGFAVTTRALWPKNSRSYLFKKNGSRPIGTAGDYSVERCEIDNYSTVNQEEDYDSHNGLGGDHRNYHQVLEMRDLTKTGRILESQSNHPTESPHIPESVNT